MIVFLTFLTTTAAADELISGTRYLRNVSIDLLGRAPTLEEYEQIEDGGTLPASLLEQWLSSEEFANQVALDHKRFFWNNVSTRTLSRYGNWLHSNGELRYAKGRASSYRYSENSCGDWEEQFDEDGFPDPVYYEDGTRQEGWVWVAPYWDPENPIKVCAYDAQERLYSTTGVDCRSAGDTECGCGPGLAWCKGGGSEATILDSFANQLNMWTKEIVLSNRPYYEILNSKSIVLNGPLVHFYKYYAYQSAPFHMKYPPLDIDVLPNLDFTDTDTWIETAMDPRFSGVLTTPGYLLRFTTNRSRANQYNSNFNCNEFLGPTEGLPAGGSSAVMPDLTQRDGCKYCHARLEPMAAHWGRWTQAGASYLSPNDFDAFSDYCAECGLTGGSCDAICQDHYIISGLTAMEQDWIGWLEAYQFLQERYYDNVEIGPEALVQESITTGSLSQCVVEKSVEHLMNRSITESELEWKTSLVQSFIYSNYSYKELIRSIVTSDQYRKVYK